MKALLALVFILAGCGSAVKEIQPFTAGAPLQVQAQRIEPVIQGGVTYTNLKGHQQPASEFEEALLLWTVSTFVPANEQGTLFVTFEKASLKEMPIPKSQQKETGFFTKQPTTKLDALIKVHLELRDVSGKGRTHGHFMVERSTTLSDNATLAEKTQKMTQLYNDLIHDLDGRLRMALEEGVTDLIL